MKRSILSISIPPKENPAVRELVERLPQWLRTDLSSADVIQRQRAQDALIGMIATITPSTNRDP